MFVLMMYFLLAGEWFRLEYGPERLKRKAKMFSFCNDEFCSYYESIPSNLFYKNHIKFL